MPLFLLSPLFRYGMAAILVLGLLGAIYGKGHSDGTDKANRIQEARIARMVDESAKLQTQRIADIAALERERESLNTRLSKEVSDAHQETADAHLAYNAAVDKLLRSRPRVAANCPTGTAETASAPRDTELATPTGEFNRETFTDLGNLAAAADNTEAVMKACQAFAISVGR